MNVDALVAFNDCVTLLDALQCVSVGPVQANRYVAPIVRETLRPSVVEVYGGGSIIDMANDERRDLNVLGKAALDLRTQKPDGTRTGTSRWQRFGSSHVKTS